MSDKIKTLSQAIRLGATFAPQCHGRFSEWRFNLLPERVATCAFGAAAEAVGAKNHFELWDRFNDTLIIKLFCPACFFKRSFVKELVFHLNDDHRWTRERIADWLEKNGY